MTSEDIKHQLIIQEGTDLAAPGVTPFPPLMNHNLSQNTHWRHTVKIARGERDGLSHVWRYAIPDGVGRRRVKRRIKPYTLKLKFEMKYTTLYNYKVILIRSVGSPHHHTHGGTKLCTKSKLKHHLKQLFRRAHVNTS